MKLPCIIVAVAVIIGSNAWAQAWQNYTPNNQGRQQSQPAGQDTRVFRVSSLVLYQVEADLKPRMPAGPVPLSLYVNALKAKASTLFASLPPGDGVSGAMVIVIRPQRLSRSWLVLGDNRLAPAVQESLKRLVAAEPAPAVLGPVAFAILFDVWGGGRPVIDPTRTVPIPREWEVAMRSSPRGTLNDAILDKIWPGDPAVLSGASGRDQHWEACWQADPDRAVAGCTALIDSGRETQQNTAQAFLGRGNALVAKHELDRALQDYDSAIRLNPNGLKAYINRAVVYASKGQFARAIQDDDEAIRVNPISADALNSRCMNRAILGQLQLALRDCNEAVGVRPNDPSILDSRGFTYLRLGQYAAAIADYDAVLLINPTAAESLFGRGIAYTLSGDRGKGRSDLDRARMIDPNVAKTFERQGMPPPS